MSVLQRVLEGKGVRVPPLAREADIPESTIYALIKAGKVEATRAGRLIIVTARGARPLLGIIEKEAA